MVNKFGRVALIGRPNVGKSTLLNVLLGEKISIISHKAQTTQQQITGVQTIDDVQIVFVDTPGMQNKYKQGHHRQLNREARHALYRVDLILFMVQALQWEQADDYVLKQFSELDVPVFLVINKTDRVTKKSRLYPFADQLKTMHKFLQIIPISAVKKDNIDKLQALINEKIPVGEHEFDADMITQNPESMLISELIREQIFRYLHEELPYVIKTELELIEKTQKYWKIHAIIWVNSVQQKSIVIGKQGAQLKLIGTSARQEMQNCFDHAVVLKLWVKVRKRHK